MRKKLIVVTQGIKGNKMHSNRQGMGILRLFDFINGCKEEMAIDCYSGLGNSYKERDIPLINITFEDGSVWSGSFSDLKQSLKK